MKIDAESEIVVTCGSTEAMMAAMMSVVNPGDKVIIFRLFMKIMVLIQYFREQSRFTFL